MASPRLRKIIDEISQVRCASGLGLVREEVWIDAKGDITRYNLAFINHFLTRKDNGRVLGYDNSHGHHHRHFFGKSEPVEFEDYLLQRARFADEVAALRKEKP